MNVQLEGIGQGNVIDSRTISYGTARTSETDAASGYTLDISGAVTDNSAYAGHGRTTEDIVCDAMTTEAALQSQYLTVMSNSVSEEDFAELTKEGFKPCETDVETAVTVVDEIKAVLAEAGIVVDGYNDDLSQEDLEKITGSAVRAQAVMQAFHENDIPVTEENVRDVMEALEKSQELTKPADGTIAYLVGNEMEPTVDDLYRAQHSGTAEGVRQSYGYYDQNGSGYYARRAEEYDWDALEEQMESVIQEAGLEPDEQSMAQARFLIEGGIPLTGESLGRLARLQEVPYPLGEEQVIRAAAAAIADGKSAGCADLTGAGGAWQQAVYWKEQTEQISDEAVDAVVESGEKLDLRHLKAAQEQIDAQTDVQAAEADRSGSDDSYISARRQLEELRLQMTITANYSLIKKGFALDTTELSQLVEQLRAAENERQQKLFAGESVQENEARNGLYTQTLQARQKLYMAPAALVGRSVEAQGTWNLRETAEQGEQLKRAYELADERYETLMTQPRSDLGDSIRKAFRNVDDILRDMELETSEENRRAVRILGYNRMEVTKEQIERIKEADISLQRVIDKLTPASVLNMVREGRNPLAMSVSELEQYLDQAENDAAAEQEKYSEYLYKLERTDGITKEEKESYIGIYRLFRQIEKSDGAVIGSLVNQNAELTMRNLLSAVRTGKHKGLDLEVSDHYGALREIARTDITIDEQIMSAYESRICGQIYDSLEPAVLHEIDLNENPTMEQLYEQLRETAGDAAVSEQLEKQERQYQKELLTQIREAADIGEEQIRTLLDAGQPVSVDHLMAVQMMRGQRNGAFSKLYELARDATHTEGLKEAQDGFLQEAGHVRDSLTDPETAKEAYGAFVRAGEELLTQKGFADGSYVDLKAYQLIGRQLHFAAAAVHEEQYRVPVEIDGRVTALDVKIRHDKGAQGFVTVAMEHESFGKAGVELEMTSSSSVSGYLAYSSRGGESVLNEAEARFRARLAEAGMDLQEFHSIFSREVNPDTFVSQGTSQNRADSAAVPENGKEHVRTSALYTVAKSFVAAMQDLTADRKEFNEV